MHILIGVTGSVASIKLPLLVTQIQECFLAAEYPVNIKVVATKASQHFFEAKEVHPAPVITDEDEWAAWEKLSDPVLHIDLRAWADILVIAPLDANTMAKAAYGLCDNLLTCILRAWDPTKPVIVCPAMNTHMWTHPMTAKHISVLRNDLGYTIIDPVSKTLACGDVGMGGMANVAAIATAVFEAARINRKATPSQDVPISE
ncbi:hypothetical protein BASA61_007581 [Batrachochytrium salamandrivorans]|nr:hypothetical protein BASA61_007581 [Batrachochytrium salamandrivorans]KAH9247997.1 hypothetical protein BASA81_014372 [Batrachochytrium salamandrivorans]